jgi:hypothetical protein
MSAPSRRSLGSLMTERAEKLSYEAAQAALDKQEKLLEELRARAGVLLATSCLATSFLGQQVFQDPRPKILAAIALIAFAVATTACVFILHPKQDLIFVSEPDAMYGEPPARAEVYRQIANHLTSYWESNNRGIEGLIKAFGLAAVSLLAQIFSLIALLGDTIVL